MSEKIYPIGIQNFEKIRKEGYFYIDKTALIYRLVKTGSYYFLSCPHRFGKSLLISTLDAYFRGEKEIHDKHYAQPFQSDKRKIFKIGVNFSSRTRTIKKWIVES